MKKIILPFIFSLLSVNVYADAPLVSISNHDQFFDNIAAFCGKAFAGKVTVDNSSGDGFDKPLIMHVRQCSKTQLHIPFHVGDDSSRTWIITKTGSGLSLKHDHRHKDGSNDDSTMYGGHTNDAGWAQVQSFPADQYSKELFVSGGIHNLLAILGKFTFTQQSLLID